MSDGWFTPIRAYCERGDAAFWAEPLNAASNAAFLVAAFLAFRLAGSGPKRDHAATALAGLVGVVGIGSFLFHTLAVRWAMLADVIPIALFIYAYFLLALRRLLGLSIVPAILATLGFAAFAAGLEPALDALAGQSVDRFSNGSIAYAPAILALIGVAAGLLMPQTCSLGPARRRAGLSLLAIAGLFALSLSFRTLDAALCPSLPIGTHFLWHGLNAAVLYGLIATAWRFKAEMNDRRPAR
ncbi:ceramidase domain-containing protein [Methylobacterium sp. 10]|uniref:ceramidase domain-containing protein n=1 Tax=Methylobacterium sp. 10 TaxID=1101191 RepID=UPI000482C5AE|nr:ceramidase domain-containing protein [Methylobacterium sp. 10]